MFERFENIRLGLLSPPHLSGLSRLLRVHEPALTMATLCLGTGIYNNNFDNAPFGYPNQPQRTWAATLGAKYKGLSISAQLYGTQNASRLFSNNTFSNSTP